MKIPVKQVALCVVFGCLLGISATAAAQSDKTSRVGSKKFTESVILGEMVRLLIQSTDSPATHREQLGGTRVLWEAVSGGDIDIYPEYTGTIDQELFPDERLQTVDAIRGTIRSEGLSVTQPLGFNNTYAIAMRKPHASRLGLETISGLRDHPDLIFGLTNEFMDREDGWPGLQNAYGLAHERVRGMDHDLAYRGLESGSIDVIDVYSTDAEIEYYDLALLKDDRDFFPSYEAVIVYRTDWAEAHPEAFRAIQKLEGAISAAEMSRLNERVKIDGESEAAVAADFLQTAFGIQVEIDREGLFERLIKRTREHLFMVLVSMLAAILIAVPLGVASSRWKRGGQVILGAVGILQTIPSLALLVFMIPLFGIGTKPAIAALFLYSLLPIVRNTYAGLEDVPDELLESARALGLPDRAILRKVELPLAMRSILAGIKTSSVWNIGIATLGALIGAGGYGQPILTGIRLDDMGLILEGALPAAGLAIAMQGLFELVERVAVPRGLRLD
jgi:osmoprotectant transport system permease protein